MGVGRLFCNEHVGRGHGQLHGQFVPEQTRCHPAARNRAVPGPRVGGSNQKQEEAGRRAAPWEEALSFASKQRMAQCVGPADASPAVLQSCAQLRGALLCRSDHSHSTVAVELKLPA